MIYGPEYALHYGFFGRLCGSVVCGILCVLKEGQHEKQMDLS